MIACFFFNLSWFALCGSSFGGGRENSKMRGRAEKKIAKREKYLDQQKSPEAQRLLLEYLSMLSHNPDSTRRVIPFFFLFFFFLFFSFFCCNPILLMKGSHIVRSSLVIFQVLLLPNYVSLFRLFLVIEEWDHFGESNTIVLFVHG